MDHLFAAVEMAAASGEEKDDEEGEEDGEGAEEEDEDGEDGENGDTDGEGTDLPAQLSSDESLVGERVSVYWRGDKKSYVGTITAVDPIKGAFVTYDDGDAKWEEHWQLLTAGPCQRMRGCPKLAGHFGRCPGSKMPKRPRPEADEGEKKQKKARPVAVLPPDDGEKKQQKKEKAARPVAEVLPAPKRVKGEPPPAKGETRARAPPTKLGNGDGWGVGSARQWWSS